MNFRYQVIGTIINTKTGDSFYITDSFEQKPIAIMHAEQTYNMHEETSIVSIHVYGNEDEVITYTNLKGETPLPKSDKVPPYDVVCKEHKLTVKENEH